MRARRIGAAALLVLAAAGCSREPAPGPADPTVAPPAAARLLDPATLGSVDKSQARPTSWTLTSAADDYTPQPCGVSVSATRAADSSATWRQGARVAQVRLLTFATPAAASVAGRKLRSAAAPCQTWLDAGASVQESPLPPTSLPGHAALAEHLTRIGDDGRTEAAWAVVVSGRNLISVTLIEPSLDGTSDVDVQLKPVTEQVTRNAGR